MDFSREAPSVVTLTAGDWVEGEISIGIKRSLTRFEDKKDICTTKNVPLSLSLT